MMVNLKMSAIECNELLENYSKIMDECINLFSDGNLMQARNKYKYIKNRLKEEHKFLSTEKNKKLSNDIVLNHYKWAIHEGMCELYSKVNSSDISKIIYDLTSSKYYFNYYRVSKS